MNDHIKIVDNISKRKIKKSSIGLFGKTGMAVYLFMLSRHSNNPGLEKQALQLLKDVTNTKRKMISTCFFERKPKMIITDFFESITGMCWAIELLRQKQYIEIDSDSFFSEIDDMLLGSKLQRSNIHQNDGVFGYGLYFLMRAKSGKAFSLTKRQILSFLLAEIEKSLYTANFSNNRIPPLKLDLLNSVLFFLIESCRTEASSALARKSVNGLMRYYKKSLDNGQPCFSDCMTASQLFERVSFMLDDETINACHAMQQMLCELMKNCDIRQKDIANLAWNGLLYNLNLNNDRIVSYINEMTVTKETETTALLCLGLLLLQINESCHERN